MKHIGPFNPPVGRQTSVILVKNYFTGNHALVTSISSRTTTEVLNIDPVTGALTFDTEACFNNEGEAIKHLEEFGYSPILRASSLLGYAVVGSTAGVLLATRLKEKATLPGGHVIQLIQDSQWVMITLAQTRDPATAVAEQDYWKSLMQHSLQGSHFFCETADVTAPFPSGRSVADPIPEFVWNTWLSQPLRELGLFHHCPVLLQGAIESADETHPTGQRYTIALLSRRSRRHPGTRYLARGLNELAGPGNEIEVDLMMWTPRAGMVLDSYRPHNPSNSSSTMNNDNDSGHTSNTSRAAAVKWSRVSWRRGTVPIWWGVDISRGLQAEVYVKEEQPYSGTLSYFRKVQKQYKQEVDAPEVPIYCINLLHINPKKAAEITLQTHFQEGMQHVKRLAPAAPLRLLNFDWHGIMGQLSEERGVEAFWTFVEPHIKATGFALGEMQRFSPSSSTSYTNNDNTKGTSSTACSSSSSSSSVAAVVAETPWGHDWKMVWHRKQQGVLRFNCADSLDRTNAATCFAMLPVLQEGLRELGVQLEFTSGEALKTLAPLSSGLARGSVNNGTSAGSEQQQQQQQQQQKGIGESGKQENNTTCSNTDEAPLPPGWEKRKYGDRVVYVDHVNKRTQWTAPTSTPTPSTTGTAAAGTAAASLSASTSPSKPPQNPRENKLTSSNAESNGSRSRNGSIPHAASAPELSSSSSPSLAGQTSSQTPTKELSSSTTASSSYQQSDTNQSESSPKASSKPWEFFSYTLQDVRDRLYRDAIADYVDMFQRHGDVHASLYTGSAAMHSHVLSLVLPYTSRSYGSGGVGKLQNLRVAVQRRWNNTVSDSFRQQAIELFLGMNLSLHCPGLTTLYPSSSNTDLGGLERDDVAIVGEPVHQAAEFKALKGIVHSHDGRLAVRAGSLGDLDPYSFDSNGSSSTAAAYNGEHGGEEESIREEESKNASGSLFHNGASALRLQDRTLPEGDVHNIPSNEVDVVVHVEEEGMFDPLGAVKNKPEPELGDLLGLEDVAPDPPCETTSESAQTTSLESGLKDLLL